MVIDNPVLGSMRNSVGGIVFYSGKSGQTARVRNSLVRNSNPYKALACYKFSALSKSWKSMTTIAKLPFNTFADSGFVPLKNTNRGQYSGYQCFMSLQGLYRKAINSVVPTTWLWGAETTPVSPDTYYPAGLIQPPGNGTVIFDIPDSIGDSIPLYCSDAHCDSGLKVVLAIGRGVSASTFSLIAFQSSTYAHYTVGVYCSEELSSVANSPANKFQKYLGNCEFSTGIAGANFSEYDSVILTLDCSTAFARMKYPPRNGKSIQLTVVIIDEYGTCQVVGEFKTGFIS